MKIISERNELVDIIKKLSNNHLWHIDKKIESDFLRFLDRDSCFLMSENDDFALFLDVGKFYSGANKENHKVFEKFLGKKELAKKIEKYLYKEVAKVVPNTFLCLTNIKFANWFDSTSLIKSCLDAYPCYNIFILSNENVGDDEIEISNDSKKFYFKSNVKKEKKSWYLDYVTKMNFGSAIFGYSIARYPDLLEVYDDYRNKTIPMILPLNNPLEQKHEYKGKGIEITLNGFETKNNLYFNSKIGASTKAILYPAVDFYSFYDAEISLNLFNVFEGARVYKIDGETYQSLFFYSFQCDEQENTYDTSDLKTTTETEVFEDKMVSDIYTVVPIRYESIDELFAKSSQDNNFVVNNILTGLSFQDNYEFGNDSGNIVDNSQRIVRLDLGTVKIMITEEPHYNYYKKTQTFAISKKPICVRLAVTLDRETHTGVLYLFNLGLKVKPTKYLDEITRNGVALQVDENDVYFKNLKQYTTDDGVKVANLYSYLQSKFNIKRVGIARNLILSPFLADYNKQNVSDEIKKTYKQMKSSLLYGEAMFEDGEELGKIIDTSLDDTFQYEYGYSVYDYNVTNVSKVAVLQYSNTYKDYLAERIDFAVVNLYYLELLQMEESAIRIATMSISNFIKDYKLDDKSIKSKNHNASSKLVLDKLERIQEEYTKTLDFWDAQTNYYSSNTILSKLRKTFEIEKDIEKLKRNHKEIQQIYDNRLKNASGRSALILSIVGIILTLISVLEIYTSAVDKPEEARYLFALEKIIFDNLSMINFIRIVLIIVFIYYLIKLFIKSYFNKKKL